MEWMFMPYRRYFDFAGRSGLREYWMFTLFSIVLTAASLGLVVIGKNVEGNGDPTFLFWLGLSILGLWLFASIIPSIAVQVRRFHDQDRSGWMILLGFIPYIGGLIVFVFMCLPGTPGPNRYGDDPFDRSRVDIFN